MNRPFVSLRSEITRAHALALSDWLKDERVTRYLSESRSVSRSIAQAIERTQMPILTHLFNQGGRLLMAHDRNDTHVGFVRLVKVGHECEIVLAIGDHDSWGRGLGASALREGLKLAFLDMRAQSVVAKIHAANTRSLKAFERCGFFLDRQTPTLKSLVLESGRYRHLLREGAMAGTSDIYLTNADKNRLESLIALEQGPVVVELEHEIERAIAVNPERVARDVATMNSEIVLRLDDEELEIALVYPNDADERSGKVSVLSDLGAAILGCREGTAIDWVISDRTRRILIERVTYQPEAAGRFHL